jgi:hypothetical protein
MKIKLLLLLYLSFLISGCEDGFLSVEEKTVNIPSSTAPTIVAFLCPQDSVHTVQLYYTSPVIGKNNLPEWSANVSKSVVTLSDESQTVALKSEKNRNNIFKIKATDFKVVAGKTYKLRVVTYDGQQAEATCTIPLSKIDIKKVDTKAVNSSDPFYLITWMDIANEQNYYAVYIVQGQVNFSTGERRVGNDTGENGILDTGREGQELSTKRSFLLQKRRNASDGFSFVSEIQLLNTDIHFYRYHKDLEILQISDDNPLSEPTNIYSNIKGGFGVFAGFTRASGYF